MTQKYYVYHINDTGDLNEGYVGFTKNPKKRWKQHCVSKLTIGCAIRKRNWNYENHFKIIFSGDRVECIELEKKLRPKPSIGLNEAAGGEGGDVMNLSERWKRERVGEGNPNWGKKRSDESKSKVSRSNKLYYNSDEYRNSELYNHAKYALSSSGANAVRHTTWWNNGTKNKRSTECPGENWTKGKIRSR